MKTHIQVLGWIYIIFGVMGMLLAIILGLLIAGGGWISGDDLAITITSAVAICIGSLLLLFSLPGVVVGAGLLGVKSWARALAIVLGIMNLMNFPIGTALGIYTLYVMLDADSIALFEG